MLYLGDKNPSMGASWVWRNKLLRFAITFVLVSGFTVLLWPRVEHRHKHTEIIENVTPNITISPYVKCEPDMDLLRRLNVLNLTEYQRRDIVAVTSKEMDLPIRQRINIPFMQSERLRDEERDLEHLHLQDDCFITPPVTVQVPAPPKMADASHIDFGVATTLGRLNESLDAFSHWAGHTNTRIFALIEPADQVEEVLAKADRLGIKLFVTLSEEEYQTRYFSLVAHLAKNMRARTRWSCIIDDDTFFLSMPALVDALAEYNDKKPMYIGGISESLPQVGIFGLMGFGGAGVFLSRPLLAKLSHPDVIEACQGMGFTGDRRISYCIYKYTDTHLTIDYRLRQLDLMGDVTGFFEAEREPPLSVHHWKSWFQADMAKMSIISKLCGDNCFLRQWKFADDWILTNGFSVIKYSPEVDADDKAMEDTWDGPNGAVHESFLHALGSLRAKDEGKMSYKLEDSTIVGDSVRQWYVYRDSENGDQKILELIWRSG